MRIVDCHLHIKGEVDQADLLARMDENGVDRVIVISELERISSRETRSHLLRTKRLFDGALDRISGLAWVNPTLPGIAGLVREAVEDMGFVGVKIIPDHFYPHEEQLESFWEEMNALHARILFHTGILYAFEDGSRFCRPVYLEKLINYPNIRFVMAHISWPWCEECLAVMGRMGAAASENGRDRQSYIDLTPGTPRHIRKQAIENAISFCGPEWLMFGSDDMAQGTLSCQKEVIQADLRLLDEIGLDESQKERIMSGTADEVFPAKAK